MSGAPDECGGGAVESLWARRKAHRHVKGSDVQGGSEVELNALSSGKSMAPRSLRVRRHVGLKLYLQGLGYFQVPVPRWAGCDQLQVPGD